MSAETTSGLCCVLWTRGGGLHAVSESVPDVVAMLSDPGEHPFLELHDVLARGAVVWIRAADVVVVREGRTETLRPAGERMS